jgi:hypothetical protein
VPDGFFEYVFDLMYIRVNGMNFRRHRGNELEKRTDLLQNE